MNTPRERKSRQEMTTTSTMEIEKETTIPIVDFAPWFTSEGEGKGEAVDKIDKIERMDRMKGRKRVAAELVEACRRVGFVYVRNHGVPRDVLETAFDWTRKLFALDLEEKMLAPHPPGPSVHRGYSWPGLEKVSQTVYDDEGEAEKQKQVESREVADVKESYEIGSEDFAQQPNIWLPEHVLPGFRAFITAFYWRCFEVAKEILRALALGLGLEGDDEDFFLRFHSGVNNQLRLLHYPPVEVGKVVRGEVARMPAHSDWGTITMLFQDDSGGLQVEHANREGHFVDATPVDGALVLNVGDLLMRWSNDYLKSTLHRVTLPPVASDGERPLMTQSRYSIPYFVSPDPTAVVECLAVCADETDRPPRYLPVTQEEYARTRSRGQYL